MRNRVEELLAFVVPARRTAQVAREETSVATGGRACSLTTIQCGATDELIAPEFLQHDPATPEEMRGPEDARQYIQMNRSAFPDIRITVENQVAGGDRVSASSVAAGKDTTKERG
jgi:hypothetical protein